MLIEKIEFVLKAKENFEVVQMGPPDSTEADSQLKRKRSGKTCHQCHNLKEEVIQCNICKKHYCTKCAKKWYPKIENALIETRCPICSDICNCGACLQSDGPSNIQDLNGSLEEIYDLSARALNILLPALEKHVEAATSTQDDEVMQLLVRADAILKINESTLETSCSCLNSEARNEAFLKAAEIVNFDLRHFQIHLSSGQPVIVRGVVPNVPISMSWEPHVMKRAISLSLRKSSSPKELSVRDASSYCEEKINIRKFFKGYSEGLFDHQGNPKVLVLELLHSSKTFQEQFPRHYRELVRCLPFKQYTHSVPDCGSAVKMSVSYGSHRGTEQWGSVTMLRYDVSDRVSILVDVTSVTSVLNKGQLPVSSNTLQDLEVGTKWDIFRKQDVPKLEEYLNKHAEEMKHISPARQMVHPNHQETVYYLTIEHKNKLKVEFGIEPWTIMQKLGDAVIVPAGCYYQMRYLKSCIHVAVDFVSPESLSASEDLFEGRRFRPSNDFQKEYKLKMKKMLLDTITRAVQTWEKIPCGLGGETVSLGFMKRRAKMMKLLLEREGHKLQLAERNMLEHEINRFIQLAAEY